MRLDSPYRLLRTAHALFGQAPDALTPAQRQQAEAQAYREQQLELRILRAPEAAGVMAADHAVTHALAEIRNRYADADAFAADLAQHGLDEARLCAALQRQCCVASVLDKIAASAPQASEVDIGIFYHSHRERFNVPETREVSHLLISINDDLPDNRRDTAYARCLALAQQLARKPQRFAELAQRHSECPSALNGGRLGWVPRDQLYPELDAALFKLKIGALDGPLESPIGFHLIRCSGIRPAHTRSLRAATPDIRRHLNQRFQTHHQKAWLAALPALESESELPL